MNDRIPYTYFIGWSELNAWYYGVRYAKNCNPTDLFNPYKTSSKIVKAFILAHGLPDVIEVRKTFNSVVLAKNHEDTVLRRLKVGLRKDFLNIKGDSFKNLDITKVRHLSGKDNPIHKLLSTEDGRKKFSDAVSIGTKLAHKNMKENDPEQYQTWMNKSVFITDNPGKNKSKETKIKSSKSQLKRFENPENLLIGTKNGRFGKENTFEHKSKISEASLNTVSCFDLELNIYCRIPKIEFVRLKTIRYVGSTSKLIPKI